MNEIGKAIYWYEKAMKLIPNDPDLKFNLEYTRTFVKDKNEEKKGTFSKVIFFWKGMFTTEGLKLTALLLFSFFLDIPFFIYLFQK